MFVLFVFKMADNLRGSSSKELVLSSLYRCLLVKWKVSANQKVSKGSILAVYKKINPNFSGESGLIVLPKLKSDTGGLVKRLLVAEGEEIEPGQAVILLDVCKHKTIMKEMCAECGADLRREPGIPGNLKEPVSASVALVHNIPELRVSQEEAEVLAKKDKEALLKSERLVLVVDLDQTLIHTTTENVPADMKDIYHFQLYGQSCWYHTKFRPGWKEFLEDMKKYYELHIFTMGSRMYAHTIARMLDPTGELFADRIRSRDESFDMFSKYRDLSALFPCDDSMVCIIDDREDIWDCAPNLITVKPYRFFAGTGDINAPPGSDQAFTHPSVIPLHESPADGKQKNDVDDGSPEKTDTNPVLVEMDIAKQAMKTDIPNKGSSTDTVATGSASENPAPIETSMKSAVKSGGATEINHNLDEQDIARKSESGSACESVNGSSMEIPDTTKHDLDESFSAVARETCDGCETVFTVPGTEVLKGESVNDSRNPERGESEEFQETNEIRKEIVEPGNEKDTTTTETGEKLGEKGGFQAAAAGVEDGGVRKECDVSELGVQEESERNVVNEKHNKGASVEGMHDDDDYLLYLDEILRRIHRRFYEILSRGKNNESGDADTGGRVEERPDLRSIVPELRRSVLEGTNVVFTGVVPTNCRHEESQAWKIATQFGAGVTRELMTRKNTAEKSRRTSHVIAASPGTEKACQALRMPGVRLVNPNWLWTCAERWEWVDERLFPVEDAREYKGWRNETPPPSSSSCDGASSSCGRFQDALNPLLSFSSGEVEAMDKEVEDLMRSSDGEEEEEEEIFGSVSSSSGSTANGRSSAVSDGSLERMGRELDGADEERDVIEGKSVNFSTIKQATKRRSVDFCVDVKATVKKARIDGNVDEANEEPDFGSSNEESSSDDSSGEDGDDNDMAAMLEAALTNS